MANFTALKTAINNAIKTNGNEEITGAILQAILDAMVETLGDSAINDLENAITTEVTNRENAVGDVAADLAAEVQARQALDYNVNNRINAEEYNRQNADAALSQTMSQGFQTLGSQMTALNAAISALNAAYQNGFLYGGIATPSSSPSNNKCFYIALQGGTYTNFGGVGVVEGINIIKNDRGWKVEHIYDQTTLLNEFYLLRQQVIRAISSIDPIVIQGDVTNAPDEEDLTSDAQHLLKFKDRAYSPLNFSGLGMKILRKNIAPLSDSAAFNGFVEGVTVEETLAGTPELIFWDRMNTRFVGIKDGIYYAAWTDDDNYVPVSTSLVYMYNGTPYQWTGSDFIVNETEVPNLVNCLTQDMINEANTIYIIRYDYTLKENITIPANCVLQFDGGSISGEYHVYLNNTKIINPYFGMSEVFVGCAFDNNNNKINLLLGKNIGCTYGTTLFANPITDSGYKYAETEIEELAKYLGISDYILQIDAWYNRDTREFEGYRFKDKNGNTVTQDEFFALISKYNIKIRAIKFINNFGSSSSNSNFTDEQVDNAIADWANLCDSILTSMENNGFTKPEFFDLMNEPVTRYYNLNLFKVIKGIGDHLKQQGIGIGVSYIDGFESVTSLYNDLIFGLNFYVGLNEYTYINTSELALKMPVLKIQNKEVILTEGGEDGNARNNVNGLLKFVEFARTTNIKKMFQWYIWENNVVNSETFRNTFINIFK